MKFIRDKIEEIQFPWIISIVLMIAGLLLRLRHYLGNRSLWLDEAMLARNILNRGPLELLTPLDYDQAAPVLFLLFVDTVTFFLGTNELSLRFIPFVASVLSLPFFLLTAQMFLDKKYVPVAVFIFVFSGNLVYYAQEFKQYSVDVAVAVALTYLAMRIIKLKKPTVAELYFFGLFGSICIFLSYSAIFVLSGIAVTFFMMRIYNKDQLPLKSLVFVFGFWGISFIGYYSFSLKPLSTDNFLNSYWNDKFLPLSPSSEAAKIWLRAGADFLLFIGYSEKWQVFVLSLVSIAFCSAVFHRSTFALMMSLFFVIAVSVSILGKYPFSDRLILYLLPFFVLLAVKGVQILSKAKSNFVYAVLVFCLLAPSVKMLPKHIFNPIRREEVRPLLRYLNFNVQPGDKIYVYYGAAHAVKYYCRDETTESASFHYGSYSRNNRSVYLEDINLMEVWPRVWFLFAHTYDDEEEFFLSHIDGVLVEKVEEHGASLYLYRFET